MDLQTFAYSVYFAFIASFSMSFAVVAVWFALERYKEKRKENEK